MLSSVRDNKQTKGWLVPFRHMYSKQQYPLQSLLMNPNSTSYILGGTINLVLTECQPENINPGDRAHITGGSPVPFTREGVLEYSQVITLLVTWGMRHIC